MTHCKVGLTPKKRHKHLKSFIKIAPYCSSLTPDENINLLFFDLNPSKRWARYYIKESMQSICQQTPFDEEELKFKSHSEFKSLKNYRFSLSHNPDFIALWIWQRDNLAAAGIDIEWKKREHSPKLLQYIRHEKDKAEDYCALEIFCLKEAAFKCLHNLHELVKKPKSLKQIAIMENNFCFEEQLGSVELSLINIQDKEIIIAKAWVPSLPHETEHSLDDENSNKNAKGPRSLLCGKQHL